MNFSTNWYYTFKYHLKNLTWINIKFKLYLLWIGGIHYGYFLEPNVHHYPIRNRLFRFFQWIGYESESNPFRSKTYNPLWLYAAKGWRKLTFNLVKELYKAGWNRNLHDSKTKYGSLRWYCGGLTDEQYTIVSKYEDLSYETCERCGSTDSVTQTDGWVYTLCKKCLMEYNTPKNDI